MRRFCLFVSSLAWVVLLAGSVFAAPADPLRLVPAGSELVVEVKQPRQLVETVLHLEQYKQLQKFEAFKEVLDSTNVRQFLQLLGYFEKQLGAQWPELLDRLGGGGAALAVKYGEEPYPVLFVIQGTDDAAMKKFTELALEVGTQELARQESKDRPEKGIYRKIETVRVGKEFHAARAGAALVFSNSEKMLQQSLDLHLDGDQKSMLQTQGLNEARKQMPGGALAFAWLDMEKVRRLPGAKEAFNPEATDPNVVIAFGGIFGTLKKTPYVTAGFYRDKDGFLLTTRAPTKRNDMGPEMVIFTPPAGQPGSRPLLEPKGVLLSSSYYMDIGRFWQDREKIFTKEQVKGLEDFEKQSAAFLGGNQFSKLLQQAGPYQRVVVVNQPKPGAYKKNPKQPLPAFAIVLELREPDQFARSMETIVRGAALLAGTQVRLKLIEEKQGDIDIIGYRFDEKYKVEGDTEDIRFNFSPCIARVGNQYIFCSTVELCHELVDLVEKESKDIVARSSPISSVTKVYPQGGADLARMFEDALIAQIVLDQGVGTKEAKMQVDGLLDMLRRLGGLQIEEVYGDKEFRFDLRLQLGK